MACPHSNEVQRLLEGSLSAEMTHRVMDHIRGCDDCRGRLNFQTEATNGNTPEERAGAGLRYQRYSFEDVQEARTRRSPHRVRGLLAAAILIVLIVFAMRERLAGGSTPQRDEPDAAIAIAAGMPVLHHPEGVLGHRPRVFSTWIPADTQDLRVRISSGGELVHEWPLKLDAPGVIGLERTLNGPRGSVPAIDLTAPFPGKRDLPLEENRPYEIRVLIGEQGVSPPLTFQIQPR